MIYSHQDKFKQGIMVVSLSYIYVRILVDQADHLNMVDLIVCIFMILLQMNISHMASDTLTHESKSSLRDAWAIIA